MRKGKTNKNTWIIGAIAIFIFLAVAYSQSFSVGDLKSDTVYTPVFTNTECTIIEFNHIDIYDWEERQNSDGWITEYCSRNDHQVYTNKCELEINREKQGVFSIRAMIDQYYVCPYDVKFDDRKDGECRKYDAVAGGISFTNKEVIYAHADDGIFGGSVDENEIQIKKIADRWGLKSFDSSNFLTKEISCDVSRLKDAGFTYLKEELQENAPNGILGFNSEINYITASSPTISKNIILYDDEVVWTIGNSEVCPLDQDVDNIKFVNIQKCYPAPEIICNPALSYCSDDGTKIINIDATSTDVSADKECNELYGSFLNTYVPNPSNINKVCQKECDDGALVDTKCKTIPSCGDGEVLNQNYICVNSNVVQDDITEGVDSTFIFIILGFLIVILIMVVIKQKRGKK